MRKRGLRLFTVLGFEVRLDFSWLFLGALISWSFAVAYYPVAAPQLTASTYWCMGVLSALGLMLSIVIHELCHALVARRHGVHMRGIVLFILGGVAEMGEEPPTPRAEFHIAAAGPLASLVLAAILFLLASISPGLLAVVLQSLAIVNVALALFNLVPAFPLDGGRILRSALWAWKKDLLWATAISAALGKSLGVLLIALGALELFSGNALGGIWRIFIGFFVRSSATQTYGTVLINHLLRGAPVRMLMRPGAASIAPGMRLDEAADVFPHHHFDWLPVVDEGRHVVGCINLDTLLAVPRHAWPHRTAGQAAEPCDERRLVDADADAADTLRLMGQRGLQTLLVVESGRIAGTLEARDAARFVATHVRIHGTEPIRPLPPHGKTGTQPSAYPMAQMTSRADQPDRKV